MVVAKGADGTGFAERVAASWADPAVLPDLERWTIGELESGLRAITPTTSSLDDAGVIVLLGPGGAGSDRGVLRLADLLEQHNAPAVFVAPTEAAAARAARTGMLTRRGMVAISGEDDAERAAVLIQGMAARQPLVRRLAAEAGMSQRTLSGAQSELGRLEGELREAARVQQNFSHRMLPDIEGLDVGAVYRPAGHVSGDVFDIEVLDRDRVGIFLADAAGHGVPAAMLTLFISRALPKTERSGGRTRIIPPGEALARLNHDFACRGGNTDRFATAVYAIYDTQARTMTVAGAGHPAPLLIGPDTDTERVETDGPLLGVFPDATFAESTVELPEGRSVVLFSDGWEVAFPKDGADEHELKLPTQTYIDRLSSLARACASGGSQEAVSDMLRALDGQAGSLHQPDDVTALVLTGVPRAASKAA